jgi:hypothetical protein
VYQVWAAGAIPIARKSSPLMERYIPCKKCVLFLEDFENIPAVLDEMRRIANSEDAWEEYMAWKSHPNPEVMANLPCRLAEKHLKYQQKRQRNEAYFHPWNHVAIDDHAAHVAEQHRLLEPAGIPALAGVGHDFFRDARRAERQNRLTNVAQESAGGENTANFANDYSGGWSVTPSKIPTLDHEQPPIGKKLSRQPRAPSDSFRCLYYNTSKRILRIS